jgi:hypothetical protein
MLNTTQLINIAKQAAVNPEVVEDNFDALYEYYTSPDRKAAAMPYGTAKARAGDPYQWIEEQLSGLIVQKSFVFTR